MNRSRRLLIRGIGYLTLFPFFSLFSKKVSSAPNELTEKVKNREVKKDESELPNDVVSVGTIVKVKDYDFDEEVEYSIVGSAEADPMNFKISNESPVGSALVGKKVGDIVEVAVPDGVNKFEVLGIRRD